MILPLMPVPETTSAEAFERYIGGKCLRAGRGEAWRNIKAWIVALPSFVEILHLPSVSEPFLAWTISGEVEFQEREGKRPWITESRPGESVKYKMEFVKPMASSSDMTFTFKSQGNQTEVTCAVTGEKPFMMKAFCMFADMDKMIGGKFEKAFAELKTSIESSAK